MATILYVDDEDTIGRLVARYFTRRGDTVLLAKSIREGQDILRLHTPDKIFLDLRLGHENGFELMAWIDEELPEISDRVAFVTGELVDEGEHRRIWGMLGHQFIQKPFALSALSDMIDRAATRASA